MGSRSRARARAQASVVPDTVEHGRPLTVALAALVQAVQSLAIFLAAVLAAIAAIPVKSLLAKCLAFNPGYATADACLPSICAVRVA